MAKKTFPVNKAIKKNSSKANGAKIEKPSVKAALRKHPNGKPKAVNKPDSKKRVETTKAPKSLAPEQQLAQREAELTIINSIQEGLASKLDMQAIYDLVGNKIRDIFDAQVLLIVIFDHGQGISYVPYTFEKGKSLQLEAGPFTALERYMIRTRQMFLCNEHLAERAEELFGSFNVTAGEAPKSMLAMPLIVGDQVKGIINLQNIDREYAFSDSDVRLLDTIANSMSVALENARLFDETQRLLKETEQRNAELAIINSVQAALAAELNIQGIYDAVGDKIRGIFHNTDMDIRIYDPRTNLLHFPYVYENGERLTVDPVSLQEGGFAPHVLRTRKTLVINENALQEMEKYGSYVLPGTQHQEKSAVFVPLVVGDQARGLITLTNIEREHAFSDSDVRLLQTLANSMSIALENARLFDETNRDARESAALNEVGRDISSTLELSAVMEKIASHASELLKAETSAIFLPEAGGTAFRAIVAQGVSAEEIKADMIIAGEGIIGTLAQQGKAEFINDTSKDPRGVQIPGTLEQAQERLMVAPLLTGEKVGGMMAVWRSGGEPFVQADLEFLEELSLQAAIAIKNANLFDESQRLLKETEQRNAELAIINSVQQGLASKLEMQAIYDLVGDKIQEIFEAHSVLIITFDRSAELTNIRYNFEKGRRYYSDPYPFTGLHRHLLHSGRTVLINEQAEKSMKEWGMVLLPDTEASKSMLFVPLNSGSGVTGAISLQNVEREHAFSEADVRLLETLASSMSVALENARLFDETQRLLKETEQRNAELAIINSVQDGLSSKLDMQAIYDLVGDKLREIFKADTTFIAFHDENRADVIVSYYADKDAKRPFTRPYGNGLYEPVVESGKPLLLGTEEQARQHGGVYRIKSPGAAKDLNESFMGVPIFKDGRAIGATSVQSYKQYAYDQNDLRLLTTLTNSMSVALENARLFDETQRLLRETEQRAAELQIINSVQEGLARKLDLREIVDLVGEKIGEIFEADTVSVGMYNAEQDSAFNTYYVDRGQRIPIAEGPAPRPSLTATVIDAREPLLIGTSAEGIKLGAVRIAREGDEKDQNESFLGVPILANQKAIGAVSVQSYKQFAFDQNDLRLLQTLANSMSVALENARLFDETQRLLKETEQRAAELAIINSAQEGLASRLEIQDIYDLVGEKIRDVFDAQVVTITTFDLQDQQSILRYGIEKGNRFYGNTTPLTDGHLRFIQARQPLLINENWEKRMRELGYRINIVPGTEAPKSSVFVPLIVNNEVRGSVTLQNVDRENAFSDSDVRLLQTLANSLSVALENARLFDETQRLLKETEQRAAELATVNTVSTALAGELDLHALIELVGEQIRNAFKADITYVALLEEATGQINFPYQYGEQLEPMQYGEGLTSKIIQSGSPLLINQDIDKRRAELGATQVGIQARSYLGVPIFVGGKGIGVLSVQSTEQENMFAEDDQHLLGTIAANVGVVLQNARLFNEAREARAAA
ncbi:MAG TPA: GAF domain-containing protein, partial [Anaerolineales bacterium]|nr:GAF domain-containing protein [Anaerolineales bacterium]